MLLFTLQWRQESGDLTGSHRLLCSVFHKAADRFVQYLAENTCHLWAEPGAGSRWCSPALALNLDDPCSVVAWGGGGVMVELRALSGLVLVAVGARMHVGILGLVSSLLDYNSHNSRVDCSQSWKRNSRNK